MSEIEKTAVCPLCREYEGPPQSVESHISGKADEIHRGELGKMHREEIRGQAESEGAGDVAFGRSFSEPAAETDADGGGGERTAEEYVEIATGEGQDGSEDHQETVEEAAADETGQEGTTVSGGGLLAAVVAVAFLWVIGNQQPNQQPPNRPL